MTQAQMPDGTILDFPDETPDSVIDSAVQQHLTGNNNTPQQPPTAMQQSTAEPAGRFVNGAAGAAMGMAEAVPHAISYISSLGGNYPNSVSNFYGQSADSLDKMEQARNQYVEDAKKANGFQGPDVMGTAGAIMSPTNGIIGKAVAALPEASSLLARAIQGIGTGAAYGAVQPADDPNQSYGDQEQSNIEKGMLYGGGTAAAGGALAKVISPNVSDNVNALTKAGIRLTPGQIAGGSLKSMEDAATSVPVLGNTINSARMRGINDMNIAVANEALNPIGQSVPDGMKPGNDLVKYVRKTLGDNYDEVIPKLTGNADQQFNSELSNLQEMAKSMPPQQQNQFNKIIDQQVTSKISPNGTISGQSYKEMQSALGKASSGYGSSADFDQRNLGAALGEVNNSLQSMLVRSNPEQAETLNNINTGWANYTRMRDAAAGIGAQQGVFTPAQLQSAVKRGDKTVGDRAFSEGDALLQDISGPAKAVMPSSIPDSGTAGRGLLALAMMRPSLAIPAAGASLLYTRPAQALTQAMMTGRQGPAWSATSNAISKATSPSNLARALFTTP